MQAWLLADAMEVCHTEILFLFKSDMLTKSHAGIKNKKQKLEPTALLSSFLQLLMSDGLTNMQVLPVANLGYLCLSLRWAEYEL